MMAHADALARLVKAKRALATARARAKEATEMAREALDELGLVERERNAARYLAEIRLTRIFELKAERARGGR